MKKQVSILLAAIVVLLLSGCFNNGSTAPPPTAFTATASDGRVILEWTASPDVEYWLFTATDPSLTAFNWVGLPNAQAYISVTAPYYLCGLYSGTEYFFAANGRIDGGPGGSSSPTISATPYNASTGVWTNSVTPLATNLLGVGYTSLTTCTNSANRATSAAGSFVTVGTGGAIFTSPDGINWVVPTTPPPGLSTDLYAVTGYAANQNNLGNPALRWVAVGAGGASVYSLDGDVWADGSPYNAASATLRSLTQVAGTFLAVGDAGTIVSSTDGINWTSHSSSPTNNLYGVTHGSIYVAVGDTGTILTSTDGSTWASIPTPLVTTATLKQVTSFGNIFVAVGDGGTIVTSKDAGATWMENTLGSLPSLIGVSAEAQYALNAGIDPELGYVSKVQFVAVDSLGNAYTSPNGYTWSTPTATGASSLNALVSSGFGYVAVGNAGITTSAF